MSNEVRVAVEILLTETGRRREILMNRGPERRKLFWLSLPTSHTEVQLDESGISKVCRRLMEPKPEAERTIGDALVERAFDSWPDVEAVRAALNEQEQVYASAAYWEQQTIEQARRQAEKDAQAHAQEEWAAKEARRVEDDERRAWIAAHGSDYLKRCIAEGLGCQERYLVERLAVDYPGWDVMEQDIPLESVSDPPGIAFDMLDTARKEHSEVKLVQIETPDGRHLIIPVARWMGRMIVWRDHPVITAEDY